MPIKNQINYTYTVFTIKLTMFTEAWSLMIAYLANLIHRITIIFIRTLLVANRIEEKCSRKTRCTFILSKIVTFIARVMTSSARIQFIPIFIKSRWALSLTFFLIFYVIKIIFTCQTFSRQPI